MAIVRTTHARVCEENSYLEILDLVPHERKPIDGLQDREFTFTYIKRFFWKSPWQIEVLTAHTQGCQDDVDLVRHKRIIYDFSSRTVQTTLIKEEDLERLF